MYNSKMIFFFFYGPKGVVRGVAYMFVYSNIYTFYFSEDQIKTLIIVEKHRIRRNKIF